MSRFVLRVAAFLFIVSCCSSALIAQIRLAGHPKKVPFEPVYHQPRPMASIEEASSRLQLMAGNLASFGGVPVVSAVVDRYGVNVRCSSSGTYARTQYFWSWHGGYNAPVYQQYKNDATLAFAYKDVAWLTINRYNSAQWAVRMDSNGDAAVDFLAKSETDARNLVDIFATLTLAGGGRLVPYPGFVSEDLTKDDLKKLRGRDALHVRAIDAGASPAVAAGLQPGDLIVGLGGQPYRAHLLWELLQATTKQPGDWAISVKYLRNGQEYESALRGPSPNAEAPRLRAQAGAPQETAQVTGQQPAVPQGPIFGVDVRDLEPEQIQRLAVPEGKGIFVTNVVEKSNAQAMNVLVNDVILEANGVRIVERPQLVALVKQGPILNVKVWRNGQAVGLVAPGQRPRFGVSVKGLSADELRQLAVPDAKGILVTEVATGSPAEKLKLQPGDVIIECNGTKITDSETFRKSLEGANPSNLKVWRRNALVELFAEVAM